MPRTGDIYSVPVASRADATTGTAISSAPYKALLDDLEADANLARPVSAGGTGATSAADARTSLGAASAAAISALSGRNLIINGSGRVNQRNYVSDTPTTSANQYTLDRWRVVASGQSLAFTGNDAGRTMQAPASGVEQIIEGTNVKGGTYVLSYLGSAGCTVNGVPRASGDTFGLPANTNVAVRFTNGSFSDVQIELGVEPTKFECNTIADEFARCQRYYMVLRNIYGGGYAGGPGNIRSGSVRTPVTMRDVPGISASGFAYTNSGSLTVQQITADGFGFFVAATAAGNYSVDFDATLDAEL